MPMNGLDAALGMCFLVAVLLGLWNGIVRMAFGILSVVLGAIAGIALIEPAAAAVGGWIDSPELCLVCGFLLTFGLVLLGFSIVAWLLRKSLQKLGLGWLDRALGAAASGGVLLIAAAMVSFCLRAGAPEVPLVRQSRAVHLLASVAEPVVGRLPEVWRAHGVRLVAVARRALSAPEANPAGAPAAPAPEKSGVRAPKAGS